MTKKQIRINHTEVTVPSAVDAPEVDAAEVEQFVALEQVEDAPDFAQSVAKTDGESIFVGGKRLEKDEIFQGEMKNGELVGVVMPDFAQFFAKVDTVEAWNALFFAIKALKANPSEALKASKMARLLEKLP